MSDEAPHHSTLDPRELDKRGGHYIYWTIRLTEDKLHDKSDIAIVLAWYRATIERLQRDLEAATETVTAYRNMIESGGLVPVADSKDTTPYWILRAEKAEARAERLQEFVRVYDENMGNQREEDMCEEDRILRAARAKLGEEKDDE